MSDHVEPVVPKYVPPTPTPTPKPVQTAASDGRSPFPPILFVLFLALVGASVYADRVARNATPAPVSPTADPGKPADPAASADATKPDETAKAAPTLVAAAATVEDIKAIKAEMAALAEKLAAMPKPEPAPDLKPVYDKIDGLAKTVATVADAPKKVPDEVAGKLSEAEKVDAAMKGDIDALKAEFASMKEAMKAKPAAADLPKPTDAVDAAAMTAAVDLFKANKFADALAAFKKLPADDARVLYFTALASGFSSNNWKGDTEAAVNKGIEREKAGSPAKAEIDAALGSLTKAQGKDWLDAYRAKAK